MSVLVVSTVTDDGLTPLGAKASAGTLATKYGSGRGTAFIASSMMNFSFHDDVIPCKRYPH